MAVTQSYEYDEKTRAPESDFNMLKGAEYVRLTTYRKTGVAVPTPVWFAIEHDAQGPRLVVMTQANSGKVKRLRHTARVELAPCDVRGNPINDVRLNADGHILPESEHQRADKLLNAKYGWKKMAFMLMGRLRRTRLDYLEIRPATNA